MNETKLLLNAYYEALYNRLETGREFIATKIEKFLRKELAQGKFGRIEPEKLAAYRDACLAFVDERLEAYNPVGIQYTYDKTSRQHASQLELQLDWYDSRTEFEALVEAAKAKAKADHPEKEAEELIKQVGAFPDKSIISGYEAEPKLGKLPDYVVARAIEEFIR